MLLVFLAFMTVLVAASVAVPLMKRPGPAPERSAFDRAVYRDQLKELERDIARGLIEPEDAAAARLEIERRLLAADAPTDAAPPSGDASPRLALAVALLLPVTAILLYLSLGAPNVPDQPYAARGPERALAAANGPTEHEKAAAELREKLKANPENADDWLLLARTEAALSHWQKSAEAYREALRITKGRPDVAAAYGEMLVMAADGIVTPGARDAFAAALGRDAKNMVARFYLGLAEAQGGNAAVAIEAWQRLAADLPAGSELRGELKLRMAEAARAAGLPEPTLPDAAPGPSADDVAQAARMTPEQRQQMINTMVEGLAARLEANPDDLDGWMRLGRAYVVLGKRDKAADAYERASTLRPDDTDILLAEAAAMLPEQAAPETAIPERVVTLLRRVEALDPKQPKALWYLGLAAAQQRHFAEASSYWERLAALYPAGSEQQKAIGAALEAIKGK